MKKATKVLALMLCAVLLVTATVAGTLAYLTSSDTVENTFTVGSVTITLDETLVTLYGEPGKEITNNDGEKEIVPLKNGDETSTTKANEYKLIPGHNYKKDPTIHVGDSSEKCYLFAKIENGLGTDATIIKDTANGTKWTEVDGADGYWKYSEAVSAGADVKIFDSFTFANDANPSTYEKAAIKVTAYAIQADGLTLDQAWTALDDQLNLTTNP